MAVRFTSSLFTLPRIIRVTSASSVKRFSTTQITSVIDESEAIKFRNFASHWWDENGDLCALHSMNKLRVPFIRDGLRPPTLDGINDTQTYAPLADLRLLDVGCGGGILSEPLANLGAHILGIDQVSESIGIAQEHATISQISSSSRAKQPEYRMTTLENLSKEMPASYDGVILSEVLEHVSHWENLLRIAADCLKPNGMLFITTINRTTSSYLMAILGAEYVAGIVPRGTHEWSKFIDPNRLQVTLLRCGLQPHQLFGMCYNPLTNMWHWSNNVSVNYALSAIKSDVKSG